MKRLPQPDFAFSWRVIGVAWRLLPNSLPLLLALPVLSAASAVAGGPFSFPQIPDSNKWSKEEWNRFFAASKSGAPLDLTLYTASADGGAPVEGAELRWLCPPPYSTSPGVVVVHLKSADQDSSTDDLGSFAAVSDRNGIARLQGVATNWPNTSHLISSAAPARLVSSDARFRGVHFPALRVSREGFYTRLSPMRLGPPDESGAWVAAPADDFGWGTKKECLLRPVRNPHPMRVSSFEAGAAFPDAPVGYDADKGAFLPPLGDGETADFFVESGETPGAWPCATYRWLILRPDGPDGALAVAPAFPDELRTPTEIPAPETPAHPFLRPGEELRFLAPFWSGRAGAVFDSGCTAPAMAYSMTNRAHPAAPTADEGGGQTARHVVVFRSRVRRDDAGGIAAARYGVIVPPDIGDGFLRPIRFLVRFNESENDCRLEPSDFRAPDPVPWTSTASAPAGERRVEGPWAYRLLPNGRAASLAGFAAIPEIPDGILALPAELGGVPVVEIESGAFSPLRYDGSETTRFFHGFGKDSRWWLTNDVELVIPEGVRRIGSQAFAGFVPVRSLSLPSTLEEIGRECFVDCIRLESVSLPPSIAAVPPAAFQGCLALRSASAPGARTVAPFAFAQCPDLADVQIPQPASVDFWAFRDSP